MNSKPDQVGWPAAGGRGNLACAQPTSGSKAHAYPPSSQGLRRAIASSPSACCLRCTTVRRCFSNPSSGPSPIGSGHDRSSLVDCSPSRSHPRRLSWSVLGGVRLGQALRRRRFPGGRVDGGPVVPGEPARSGLRRVRRVQEPRLHARPGAGWAADHTGGYILLFGTLACWPWRSPGGPPWPCPTCRRSLGHGRPWSISCGPS